MLKFLISSYKLPEIVALAKAMRAQTRDAITERLMDWHISISSTPYTATTFAKGNSRQDLDQSSGEEVINPATETSL